MLPPESIYDVCAREKSILHDRLSMLHLWWGRRLLAVACAIIFAQLRLFRIIDALAKWKSTNNELEIEADIPDGASDEIVRIVTEYLRRLQLCGHRLESQTTAYL